MKKKSTGKLLALLLLLCVFLTGSVLTVRADEPEDSGTIEVHLPWFASGTFLDLAEVGRYEDGAFSLNERFAPSGVVISGLTEASQVQDAADRLAAYSAEQGLVDRSESYYNSGDEQPILFDGLKANGTLYLVYQKPDTNQDIIKVSPMLVLVPYVNAEGESLNWVRVDAKYERPLPDTGAVILTKVDLRNHEITLAGAEFRLEVKKYDTIGLLKAGEEGVFEDEGGLYRWETVYDDLVTNHQGQLVVEGLPFGVYRFVETKAPAGFEVGNTVVEVTVDKGGSYKFDYEYDRFVPDFGYVETLTVENTPVVESSVPPPESSEPTPPSPSSEPEPSKPSLPSESTRTGDNASKYIVVGVVVGVSLVAVVLLIVLGKKGKKNQEDDDEK